MLERTVAEYGRMFDIAKSAGKKISKKGNIDVYKVTEVPTYAITNKYMPVNQRTLEYFASFKDGKPFRIVDQSLEHGKLGRTGYDANTNIMNITYRHNGSFNRSVKNAETGEEKGRLRMKVGNDGYVDFASMYVPGKGTEVGEVVRSKGQKPCWYSEGMWGPYWNILGNMRDFNKALK